MVKERERGIQTDSQIDRGTERGVTLKKIKKRRERERERGQVYVCVCVCKEDGKRRKGAMS